MVKTVVREHHWPPDVIGGLFVDDADSKGLEFWYDDILEVIEKINPKKRK